MFARSKLVFVLILLLSISQLAMGRHGQYDEEARAQEKLKGDAHYSSDNNPITGIASGLKQATYDSTAGLLSETAEETKDGAPIVGTLEGARKGTEGVVNNTVKGAFKVATLGYGEVDNLRTEEPEHGTDETTKFKFNF